MIAAFGKRVGSIHKNNGGQASAVNAVFREVTGELVLFLDADDFLYPNACAMIVGAWRPEYSKVQFPLRCVDAEGRRLPCCLVGRRLDSGEVWKKLLSVGYQEPAHMSGNAWRAGVLKKILPMPEGRFRISADDYLNSLAPFDGSVGVIQTPLGACRLHASSHWSSQKAR